MPTTKVTEKYQVTIPKEVRVKVGLRPGEILMAEVVSEEELRLKRFKKVKDPLRILIGRAPYNRHVPVEELEERIEAK